MHRVVVAFGLLLFLLLGLVMLSRTLTTDRADFPSDDGPSNPLAPCPTSPNCVRLTRVYAVEAGTLFAHARAALTGMNPLHLKSDDDASHLDAVFRVLVFKDDLTLRVAPNGTGSVLHLRSASRTGHSDFGVNGRRVRAFLEALEARLQVE